MEKIFFAYENSTKSGSSINVDAIKKAKTIVGEKSEFQIKTWEDLRNNGRVLIKAIFEAIDECDIFACDLSFMNNNVMFELGYAIAKGKKLCLLINPKISDASAQYSKIDVLKTVGYSIFTNGEEIINVLKKLPTHPKLLDDLCISGDAKHKDVFYIQSTANSQVELDTFAWFESANLEMICDDPMEIEYRTFAWYIESILCTSCVVVHLTDTTFSDANTANPKASLFAGISCGKGKKTVLLVPKQYDPPIDYADISIKYSDYNDCVQKLENWTNQHLKKRKRAKKKEDIELNLLKLE